MNSRIFKLAAVAVILIGSLVCVLAVRKDDPPPDRYPVIAQAGWNWETFYGVSLPSSAKDGPLEIDADRAIGFTRTPEGALLAAIHLLTRVGTQVGSGVYEPTLSEQATGPGVPALLEYLRKENGVAGVAQVPPAGPVLTKPIGYRLRGYTPDLTDFELVIQRRTDTPNVTEVQVRWIDSDWRLVVPAEGHWMGVTTPLGAKDDYVPLTEGR